MREHEMKLAMQGDRRKNPELREYRPMTLEEAKLLRPGDRPATVLRSGRVGVVKVNGQVRTWKRDPMRIEIPVKYGMYEYTTFEVRDGLIGNDTAFLVVAV